MAQRRHDIAVLIPTAARIERARACQDHGSAAQHRNSLQVRLSEKPDGPPVRRKERRMTVLRPREQGCLRLVDYPRGKLRLAIRPPYRKYDPPPVRRDRKSGVRARYRIRSQ